MLTTTPQDPDRSEFNLTSERVTVAAWYHAKRCIVSLDNMYIKYNTEIRSCKKDINEIIL